MTPLYIRRGKTIFALTQNDDGEVVRKQHAGFESINLAKKAPRLLQQQHGGRLGSGLLRVER